MAQISRQLHFPIESEEAKTVKRSKVGQTKVSLLLKLRHFNYKITCMYISENDYNPPLCDPLCSA